MTVTAANRFDASVRCVAIATEYQTRLGDCGPLLLGMGPERRIQNGPSYRFQTLLLRVIRHVIASIPKRVA